MCRKEEETALHLMQACHTGRKIWEKIAFRCQTEGRIQGDLNMTLRKWKQSPFKSNLLNALWCIIPGLTLWNLWKERNRRIFKDQTRPLEKIWNTIHQNITESLSLKDWSPEDLPTTPKEINIWENWQIKIQHNLKANKRQAEDKKEDNSWQPPPLGIIQLNFDGASKGNPGKAGYGGVFRTHQGYPLLIFMGPLGWDTNNSAELEGLWRGLKIAQERNLFPLTVKGDSQILIRIMTKLQNGSTVSKVSSSWRMLRRLELIKHWLNQHQAISFKHTRREGNKLADLLANFGVEEENGYMEGALSSLTSRDQIAQIQEIVTQEQSRIEHQHPDAGVSSVM